ncbi:MAG TPA: molybdenum ABC transporter ATP-binding protein [Dongiaceae bacterium]|nr:molybdenum ABC transporter ATP-binding protein [Dongiaceae bacterium]
MLKLDIGKQLGAFRLQAAFEAPSRGATVMFGPSGAGKSALLSAVAGLQRPDQGIITLDDDTLFDSARGIDVAAEDRRIGFVFQEARLFPHMSVRSNLDYGRKRRRDAAAHTNFDDIVALLGIGALLERRPGALSGGEKQRVAIGRALLSNPRLLLLDEPLAALDDPRKAEILPFLERLRDEVGVPMLYVTHAMEEVTRIADHLVLLDQGRVQASGPTADLMGRLDLPLLIDRTDAGVVLIGTISGHDAERGVTRVAVGRDASGGAEFLLSHVELPVGHAVRLRVLARDVAIATKRPEELSVQNVLPGRLIEMMERPNRRCLLRIAVGDGEDAAILLALLTADSARRLNLRLEQKVFALIKSVASNALI